MSEHHLARLAPGTQFSLKGFHCKCVWEATGERNYDSHIDVMIQRVREVPHDDGGICSSMLAGDCIEMSGTTAVIVDDLVAALAEAFE